MGIFLALGTLVGYVCAVGIEKRVHAKLWLSLGLLYLFGMLFLFKYLDFTCRTVLSILGSSAQFSLGLALPLGISFYTFSIAGYLLDVFRQKMPAERNFLRFAAFASFFPSILSGPINRGRELLPQLAVPRGFDLENFKAGLWRFLCGAAKKMIVVNLLQGVIDSAYADPTLYSSGMWIIFAATYSVYLYIDFSAYSDMAIGTAKMLNLTLMENFRAPFFSRSTKELWKKWHISLTSWFREYIYFPLGGSRRGKWRTRLNVLIVFAVSGLWHGAGLTFLIWGLLFGVFQAVGDMTSGLRTRLRARLRIPEDAWYTVLFQTLFTFALFSAAFIFFRAESVEWAVFIIKRILLIFRDGFGAPSQLLEPRKLIVLAVALLGCFLEDLAIARGRSFSIERTTFRFWIAAAVLAAALLLFGQYGPGFNAQDFVYFKF